jgi:hypothetical protein
MGAFHLIDPKETWHLPLSSGLSQEIQPRVDQMRWQRVSTSEFAAQQAAWKKVWLVGGRRGAFPGFKR